MRMLIITTCAGLVLAGLTVAQDTAPKTSNVRATSPFGVARPAASADPARAPRAIGFGSSGSGLSTIAEAPAETRYFKSRLSTMMGGGGSSMPREWWNEQRNLQNKIKEATAALSNPDKEKQEKAKTLLETAVGELFEVRSRHRQYEIDELSKRLDKLQAQLTERKDKKSEIVRLHIQTIVNESKGLGF